MLPRLHEVRRTAIGVGFALATFFAGRWRTESCAGPGRSGQYGGQLRRSATHATNETVDRIDPSTHTRSSPGTAAAAVSTTQRTSLLLTRPANSARGSIGAGWFCLKGDME
jgi:hypothetical protein